MGVPAFFRWLSKKYPAIVVHAVEEKPTEHEEKDDESGATRTTLIYNSTQANPNDVEFDNLYLDMNGIIHPCCHPENKPAPRNEEEMMVLIFEYIDRLFNIIRPRRLLYMAIDGVAPRAKMNQQRSRRFRSAKEVNEKHLQLADAREKILRNGCTLPPAKDKSEHFDSNCITPGTEFMDRLAVCLRFYVHDRVTNDPGWAKIQVILSDANVPGEGEHKIMDYIRKQRASPTHDPNTHHCLCGADADLIMLGLATHEAQFTIIREEFKPNVPRPCELCNQFGHEIADCKGLERNENPDADKAPVGDVEFIFLRLSVLREYLRKEFADLEQQAPSWFNFERALDDWVFMCFFVGNDFLPHLPSLEIREGAIDRLIRIYKRNFIRMGGYLANAGIVDLSRVERILMDLGRDEDDIFRQRQQRELEFKQREKDKAKRMKLDRQQGDSQPYQRRGGGFGGFSSRGRGEGGGGRGGSGRYNADNSSFMNNWSQPKKLDEFKRDLRQQQYPPSSSAAAATAAAAQFSHNDEDNKNSAAKLKQFLVPAGAAAAAPTSSVVADDENKNKIDAESTPAAAAVEPDAAKVDSTADDGGNTNKGLKRTHSQTEDTNDAERKTDNDDDNDEEEEEVLDDIRLHEEGWRERYYSRKFLVPVENQPEFRKQLAAAYVEGLCWVLRYYYQGCASWEWYFAYHYAPFASDFQHTGALSINFPYNTKPFKPLEQLMAVFPAASKQFLPRAWQPLMYSPDSPIIDFYPRNFGVDLNGKKFAWQGVALLPHVDEDRLLSNVERLYHTLTSDELRRNSLGNNILFVGQHHTLHDDLRQILYETGEKNASEKAAAQQVKSDLAFGMRGSVWSMAQFSPNTPIKSPIASVRSLQQTLCVAAYCADPQYPPDFLFSAARLPQAREPEKVLRPEDFPQQQYNNNRNNRYDANDNYNSSMGGRGRGGGGGGRDNNNWRGPHIGFNATRGAGRLDESRHRHIVHAVRRGGVGGQFSNGPFDNSNRSSGVNIAPPASLYSDNRHQQSRGGGGFHGQSRRPYDDRQQYDNGGADARQRINNNYNNNNNESGYTRNSNPSFQHQHQQQHHYGGSSNNNFRYGERANNNNNNNNGNSYNSEQQHSNNNYGSRPGYGPPTSFGGGGGGRGNYQDRGGGSHYDRQQQGQHQQRGGGRGQPPNFRGGGYSNNNLNDFNHR